MLADEGEEVSSPGEDEEEEILAIELDAYDDKRFAREKQLRLKERSEKYAVQLKRARVASAKEVHENRVIKSGWRKTRNWLGNFSGQV